MNFNFGPFTTVTVLDNGTLRIYNSMTNDFFEIQPEVLEDIIQAAFLDKNKVSSLLERAMTKQARYNRRVG